MFSSHAEEGDHHTSIKSFRKAAADGCLICAPLLKQTRKWTDDLDRDFYPYKKCVYSWSRSSVEDTYGSLRIEMWIKKKGMYRLRTRMFLFARRTMLPVGTSVYGRRSAIPMNECLLAAQEWMSTCVDKHEQCQKHTQPHTYPTRLLKLESHNIRLVLPQDDQISGPYAALSYCWGPNPNFIRLTTNNLQEFRVGIPYTTLPIAFQEAILIVKELGIRYLWIDALCIIQSGLGSSEDWQFESGRMQEVYSNCIVNLSLAQAANPNQSCLGGYTLDSTPPFEADIVYGADDAGARKSQTYTILSEDYFREALYQQPIGSRAWVMQEGLLATRVLSIGHGELFWDCQQVPYASESLPLGFTLCSNLERDELWARLSLSVSFISPIRNSGNLEMIWSELLNEYTACELTYPQADKLVALSAISTRMGYAMSDTCLGGHFCRTLPQSLNWRINIARAEKRMPNRMLKSSSQTQGGNMVTTPSWSWASMDGQLDMGTTQREESWSVAAMEAYEVSPSGQIAPEAQLENKLLLTIRTWCRIIEWRTDQLVIIDILDYRTQEPEGMKFVIDGVHAIPDDRSRCLLAALTHDYHWPLVYMEGLLLREVDFNGNKVYERMGQFEWLLGKEDEVIEGDWKAFFTLGERSITLC
jgi:hypothetical protein